MDAPVTAKVPPTVEFPVALNVVNAPVDFEFAPIAVPSIAPPFISTLDNVDVPLADTFPRVVVPATSKVPSTATFPDAEIDVKFALEAEFPPITVLSIAPPFISTVDNVEVPVTPKVPPTVVFPVALNDVNAPLDVELEPIAVPSIAPPFMSTAILLVPTKDLKVEMLFVLVEMLV